MGYSAGHRDGGMGTTGWVCCTFLRFHPEALALEMHVLGGDVGEVKGQEGGAI